MIANVSCVFSDPLLVILATRPEDAIVQWFCRLSAENQWFCEYQHISTDK